MSQPVPLTRYTGPEAFQLPLPEAEQAALAELYAQRDCQMTVVIGSQAYGTARPDSDVDLRGFYLAPTRQVLSLRPPTQVVDRDQPDMTFYELGKFVSLLVSNNPNALEMLYAPVLYLGPEGELLRSVRDRFLSRRVLKTYGGYAMQQLKHAKAGTGGSRGAAHFRREKFSGHLVRLQLTAISLLQTGTLQVRMENPELFHEAGTWDLDRLEQEFHHLDARFKAAAERTSLPEEPDLEWVDQLLVGMRLRHLPRD